jgi:hypothetical protein
VLGAWADVLTAWQKAAFAIVYEVCLIALMITIEVLGHASAKRHAGETAPAEPMPSAVPMPQVPNRPKLPPTENGVDGRSRSQFNFCRAPELGSR